MIANGDLFIFKELDQLCMILGPNHKYKNGYWMIVLNNERPDKRIQWDTDYNFNDPQYYTKVKTND